LALAFMSCEPLHVTDVNFSLMDYDMTMLGFNQFT